MSVTKKVMLLFLFGLAFPVAAQATPQPEVVGNKIVNQKTGKQFIPHGVNWPSFEYSRSRNWSDYSQKGISHKSIRAMTSWKINTVRVPLNQDAWLGQDGVSFAGLTRAGYRRKVIGFVNRLNRHGLVVIVDIHWSAPPGVPADGMRAAPDQSTVTFWKSVANTFQRNKSVIFDLFNEPYSRWDRKTNSWAFRLSWSCWAEGGCRAPIESNVEPVSGRTYETVGFNELIRTVRSTGARQPIMVAGRDYANGIARIREYVARDRQLIVSFHTYPHQVCDHPGCWDKKVLPVAKRMPVLTGEFGEKDCKSSYIDRYMSWADKHKIGYLAWGWWRPIEGCRDFGLIRNLSGKPSSYGKDYRKHLLEIAN